MALVRGTPQLLVETDADGGLGFESRDGRSVAVVTRDNLALKLSDIGSPFKFPNFKKSLLPSLVAGATASRSAGVVTIAATAHGITTGSTYQGFRVFYPGSPGLAAGWYDAILSVPDANTLTFSAPGPDFGSESVNGGAAYTLSTDFCLLTVPGGLVQPGSSIRLSALWGGDTTAALKSQRMRIGSTSIVVKQTSTAPHCEVTSVLRIGENLQTQYIGSAENAAVVNISAYSFDFSGDVAIGVAGTLPSAGTFLTLYGASLRVEI